MISIDLTNKAGCVIGGARGIGAAVVRALGSAGAHVAWTHLGHPADCAGSAELARIFGGMGRKYMERPVDCADPKGTACFIADVAEKWGQLDYLVYCAGLTSPAAFMEIEPDAWQRHLDINLNGAYYAARAALPAMLAQRQGAIVLVGSAAIVSGGGGRADYIAAKAGLEGLNRALTKEFAPQGVRCNLVHPSLIETDLLKQRYPDPARRAEAAGGVPLRRLGQPDDIANAVVFLLSEMASYITGQSLFVDGGRTFCR